MMDDKQLDKARLLGASFVFGALTKDAREALAATARTQSFKAGEVIFTAGSDGSSMMAIAEGTVRISALAPTARDVVLAELHAGDVFGEITLLDAGARSADAHAQTNCTLLVVERRALLQLIAKTPEALIRLMELLCQRIRVSDERMMELAFLPLPARMARALLRASEGKSGASPARKLSLTQTEIANTIGSSRENVNRTLRKWQGLGVIELRDGWLIVRDRDALAALAATV